VAPGVDRPGEPDEDSADIPAGAVSAEVVLAGTDKVAIGPADLDLAEGVHTIVYAWGSAEDDNSSSPSRRSAACTPRLPSCRAAPVVRRPATPTACIR
jgi:hypothetical protein